MSAPRLILKHPTGWFAAGREFAQALTLLSDGAFKLYVYACLRAGRHTGCLRATVEELAQAVGSPAGVLAMACMQTGTRRNTGSPCGDRNWINRMLVRARPGRKGCRGGP
jgi:hypothetical protein